MMLENIVKPDRKLFVNEEKLRFLLACVRCEKCPLESTCQDADMKFCDDSLEKWLTSDE